MFHGEGRKGETELKSTDLHMIGILLSLSISKKKVQARYIRTKKMTRSSLHLRRIFGKTPRRRRRRCSYLESCRSAIDNAGGGGWGGGGGGGGGERGPWNDGEERQKILKKKKT